MDRHCLPERRESVLKDFLALTQSLAYIERHLCADIGREDIAAHCAVSLSKLEKLFRYALHCSIKEYVTKRRMTLAAQDLIAKRGSVTDIAMKYQYNSPEVFARAFRGVWQTTPSQYARQWRFSGIFPPKAFAFHEGEDLDMARKRVDISDAYDFFKAQQGTCVICFDIRSLMEINAISLRAGDLAILTAAARIDRAAGDDMLLLRIGGDEFALVTCLQDMDAAQDIARQVLAQNGQPFDFDGQPIPLSLWAAITRIPGESLRYRDLLADMHEVLDTTNSSGSR